MKVTLYLCIYTCNLNDIITMNLYQKANHLQQNCCPTFLNFKAPVTELLRSGISTQRARLLEEDVAVSVSVMKTVVVNPNAIPKY